MHNVAWQTRSDSHLSLECSHLQWHGIRRGHKIKPSQPTCGRNHGWGRKSLFLLLLTWTLADMLRSSSNVSPSLKGSHSMSHCETQLPRACMQVTKFSANVCKWNQHQSMGRQTQALARQAKPSFQETEGLSHNVEETKKTTVRFA